MKQALISPNENTRDPNTDNILGQRIVEVRDTIFDVAPPLFWIECDDTVEPDKWYYSLETQQINIVPINENSPKTMPITTT
jgi:hypothetical protein